MLLLSVMKPVKNLIRFYPLKIIKLFLQWILQVKKDLLYHNWSKCLRFLLNKIGGSSF